MPEGVGRVKGARSEFVGLIGLLPGPGSWVGTGAVPGAGVKAGRRAPRRGLGLDAGEERRRLITPDRRSSAAGVGWVFGSSHRVFLDLRVPAARLAGIPSPTLGGGGGGSGTQRGG